MTAAMRIADNIFSLGTESAFTVLARAKALEAQGRSIINLGIGAPDFRTPANIVDAAKRALDDGRHFYTPARGLPELCQAVADDVAARRGVAVDPRTVLIVPGGKPTMFFAILMFGQPGAEILYPDPGFPIYRSMIGYSGATPVPYALTEETGFSFDPDRVLAQITPATRLLILNSPGNPTGGVLERDVIDRLVAGLERHPHVAILSDEIYSRLLYDGRRHVSLLEYDSIRDRTILLDGWSKTYSMTGWRLGYGVWPDALIDHAERLQINSNSCASAPVQMAGIEALTGPQDAVDHMLATFDRRRKLIVERLNAVPGVRCVMPGGAFYAFANITGTGLGSAAFQSRFLEEAGVATLAGTSFGDQGEGFVRFSFAASEEDISEAMNRLENFLQMAAA